MKVIIPPILVALFCLRALNTDAQIINTIAGNGSIGYSGDGGAALSAEFYEPDAVAIDAHGNYYVADWNNVVRKINTAGIITTVAGNGTNGYNGDNIPATNAKLDLGAGGGVAVDNAGNLYIADADRVRKVNTSGIITTIAGTGVPGYSGDGGIATNATLNGDNSVKVDAAGNVYIADERNNVVRKINTSGIITTIAGDTTAGYSGDGAAATNAELNLPAAIALDAAGNVYIVDYMNNVIRKVNSSGIISTYAGGGVFSLSLGDGGPATAGFLYNPYDIATDAYGNIFIADYSNFRVRKVNSSGIISTAAGSDGGGFSGDGGPATNAELSWNMGIGTDASGNLYIADAQNDRVREVTFSPLGVSTISSEAKVDVSPNPAATALTITSTDKISQITITNLLGQTLFTHNYNTSQVQVNVADLPAGMYLVKINGAEVRKFVKQ